MRVAFVGKGGAGKSAMAGTFARFLARRGLPVLAIDSDPMPGLAYSLGVAQSDAGIPDDAVVERGEGEEGPRFRLRPGLSAAEAIERYAVTGPDGVRFLQFGKLRGRPGDLFRSQMAFHQIRAELPETEWNVVGDLPGGTRQPFFGWGEFAETFLVVVEPTAKSLLSGRRLARLGQAGGTSKRLVAVASKVRLDDDVEMVRRGTGLEVVATVPWDEELAGSERRGMAPIDDSPDCPAVAAVSALVDYLAEEESLPDPAR
ncbi:MAG: nucleotide-binding protein [Acidimicrobiales bacterium]